MRDKKRLNQYEFEVVEQKHIPNKKNPEKIELSVEFEYQGQTMQISPPAFTPKQIANGQWESQICIKIDEKIDELEGETSHNVPDLKGEKIENSGYDFTGPKKDYVDR